MARPRTYAPLSVFLNRHLVGRLNRQPTGAIEFQYDRSWLEWSHTFPVSISLPLREDRYVGKPVVAVFENLLPDNEDMRRRIAARVRAKGDDAYSLLSAIGRDCVGALQFLPVGDKLASADTVNGKPIDAARVAEILAGLGKAPLGMGDDNEEFRISIAGAQEKTALLFWKKRWNIPHGSTPTTHILKPQIRVLRNGIDLSNSVENEHFCMLLTRALGLPLQDINR
jgi:serine/threonine-protein kinase HipA